MQTEETTQDKKSDSPTTTIFDALKQLSLFKNLTDEEINRFEKGAQVRSFKKGKVLYIQGEAARFFYIMRGGWVKLFHTTPEGEEIIVDMLTAGHMFGESAIFENNLYMSSAQVVESIQVLTIPSSILREQIHCNTKLALNMLSSMSRQNRHHAHTLAFNTMLSAPQRIACFLLRLCPAGIIKSRVVCELPYDKTLIASTLGMKGATFSRALNILRKKLDITIDGSSVEIASVGQLARYVYGPMAQKFLPDIFEFSSER